MRFLRPSAVLKLLCPDGLFRLDTGEKKLVLTFDDGPDPVSTNPLCRILDNRHVKAVFFCSGNKAEKFPELVTLLRSKGHIVGNHGYEHLNGFMASHKRYLENVLKASALTSGTYFRPPYGLLKPSQYRSLINQYRIIFWDLMPYDFDRRISGNRCLEILKKMIRPGSVIVLHDTEGSSVLEFIDDFIDYAIDSGYSFVTDF